MSLATQEQLLLELLFDDALLARFSAEGTASLVEYGLDEEELRDFAVLRPDALAVDARLRRSMVLSQLCIALPFSFSILSSAPEGLELLQALVDTHTMRTPALERPLLFGQRLRAEIDDEADDPVQSGLRAVLEAELGMVWTGVSIRRTLLDTGQMPPPPRPLDDSWAELPMRATSFVSGAVLPASCEALRQGLCPVSGHELWRHLAQHPTPARQVVEVLTTCTSRLLMARAEIDRVSRCDPTVRHVTVELHDGFAPLLGQANGQHSLDQLLAGLRDSGASDEILAGVEAGFRELCVSGMLEVA